MLQIEYVYYINQENKKHFPIFCLPNQVMPIWSEQEVDAILLNYGGSAYYCPTYDSFYAEHELKYLSKEVIVVSKPHNATHYGHFFDDGISYLRQRLGSNKIFEVYNPYFGRWMPLWMVGGFKFKGDILEMPF